MALLFPMREITQLADDAELLRRYRESGDAEAFEGIVRRHARTVLGVCRRVLTEPHAAEDAFQATFLQLVRKAQAVHSPAALAAWLYATARRTALRHRRLAPPPPPAEPAASAPSPLDTLTARELLTAIEGEIARLPEHYRLPLIFCYLDGLSKRAAAERLGLSAGEFRGRLDRGREKLRAALTRRGFAPAAALGLLVPAAGSASAELVRRTVGVCVRGNPTPAAVALLAAGSSGAWLKLGLVVGLFLVGGLVTASGRADPPAAKPKPIDTAQRLDNSGDPLPPGAVVRMGSVRWRHPDASNYLYAVPSPTGELVATRSFIQQGTTAVRVWTLADGKFVCEFPWHHTDSEFAFTPDGARVMILRPRGVVHFHDAKTGQLVAESEPAVGKEREGSAQHLTADGRWVVTNGPKRTMILTEVTIAGTARRQIELDAPAADLDFSRIRFSCDGRTLIAGDHLNWKQGEFHRWDVGTGKLTGTTAIKNPSGSICFDVTKDGGRFASWRYGVKPHDELVIRDTTTGKVLAEADGGDRKGYGSVAFSPDGKRVAAEVSSAATHVVKLLDVDSGKWVGGAMLPQWAWRFSLLADGKTLLAVSSQGMMFGTWDLTTGRRMSVTDGHEAVVGHLAFTPDGKTLFTSSAELAERVTAWDAATGKKLRELAGTQKMPNPNGTGYNHGSFVRTPGGAVVTTEHGTLVWTDAATGRKLRRVTPEGVSEGAKQAQSENVSLLTDPRTGKPVVSAAFAYGNPPFVSNPKPWKEVATFYDAETGELLAQRQFSESPFYGSGLTVSPDGLLARADASRTAGRSVVITSALDGRGAVQLTLPDDDADYQFTPDGQTLLTRSIRLAPNAPAGVPAPVSVVRLWEVRSGRQRFEFVTPMLREITRYYHGGSAPITAVSPDGRFLAGLRDGNVIAILDLATGRDVTTRSGFPCAAVSLAFRPDGKVLASGHYDGTALVWDVSGLPGVKPATTDRAAAWADLASADAAKAHRAILSLAVDPDGAAHLRDRVKPASAIPAADVQKVVRDLDDDDFATREAASAALKKWGDVADGELQSQMRGKLSAEQRRRVSDVLAKRGLVETDPDRLRALRCVEILERAGSGEALAMLRELARGAAGARLTGEAAAAVRRAAR